jgi:hypothetical protein
MVQALKGDKCEKYTSFLLFFLFFAAVLVGMPSGAYILNILDVSITEHSLTNHSHIIHHFFVPSRHETYATHILDVADDAFRAGSTAGAVGRQGLCLYRAR